MRIYTYLTQKLIFTIFCIAARGFKFLSPIDKGDLCFIVFIEHFDPYLKNPNKQTVVFFEQDYSA